MFYAHEFETTLTDRVGNKTAGTCLVLPDEIAERLPFEQFPKLRVDAEIDGVDHQGAWVPFGGRHKMMVSRRLLTRIGKTLGDPVRVSFNVADQDALYVPRLLATALEDPALRDAWEEMPIGKRRSWCFRIDRLKSEAAQWRNINQLTAELLG